jgi:hypothetical protein
VPSALLPELSLRHRWVCVTLRLNGLQMASHCLQNGPTPPQAWKNSVPLYWMSPLGFTEHLALTGFYSFLYVIPSVRSVCPFWCILSSIKLNWCTSCVVLMVTSPLTRFQDALVISDLLGEHCIGDTMESKQMSS